MENLVSTAFQLAQILRNRRKSLKMSQKEIASKIGILPKTVSALENFPERCSVESLIKYFSALELEFMLKTKETTEKTQGW